MRAHPFRFAILLASIAITPAFAAHMHVPTPSVWKLDVAASDFGGGPAIKSETMTMLIDTDQRARFSDVMVDANGKTYRSSWDGPQDGTFKPVKGMPGVTQSMNTATDTGEVHAPDGSIQKMAYALSADKKTVTVTGTTTAKSGKTSNQKLVYHRIR